MSTTPSCSGSRSITGCGVDGSNSDEFASSSPQTFRANSITAHLQAEAQPEVRNAALARVAGRLELALHAAPAEPAGHHDPVDAVELALGVVGQVVRAHPPDVDRAPWWNPACDSASITDRYASRRFTYLPDDRDVTGSVGPFDRVDQRLPLARGPAPRRGAGGGRGRCRAPPRAASAGPRRSTPRRSPRPRPPRTSHSSEIFSLRLSVIGRSERQHDRVGLDTDRPQLAHGVLGGLGLGLAGRPDERHQRDVDEGQLSRPTSFRNWRMASRNGRRLDVADGAADLDDHDVGVLGLGERADAVLDLVGDVRDDLDGLAEVLAAALLGDHGLSRRRRW